MKRRAIARPASIKRKIDDLTLALVQLQTHAAAQDALIRGLTERIGTQDKRMQRLNILEKLARILARIDEDDP